MGSNLTMMGRSLYKWRQVRSFADGHRFFIDDNSGKMAVADYSGALPDDCEDGVLWLPEAPGIVRIIALMSVRYPVLKDGDDNVCTTIGSLKEGVWVAELRGWKIMIEDWEVTLARRQEDRTAGS